MSQELILPGNPNLVDFQNYVKTLKIVRGFENDANKALILLMEELGELSKEIRKTWNKNNDFANANLSNELADVFIYLLDICNQFDVSLEEAFRAKEEINKKRVWK